MNQQIMSQLNPAAATDISLATANIIPGQSTAQQVINNGYKNTVEEQRVNQGNFTPQYGNYNSPEQNQKINRETDVAKYKINGQIEQEAAMNAIINRGMADAYESEREKYQNFETSLANKNAKVLNATGVSGLDRYKGHEGFRGNIYTDSEGHLTVGYGHKLTDDDKRTGRYAGEMTKAQADSLLRADIAKHNNGLYKRNPWLKSQPRNVQVALEDMAFNMGSLKDWKGTTNAIQAGKYSLAASKIQNSKYRNQVGNRALKNAQLISSAQIG